MMRGLRGPGTGRDGEKTIEPIDTQAAPARVGEPSEYESLGVEPVPSSRQDRKLARRRRRELRKLERQLVGRRTWGRRRLRRNPVGLPAEELEAMVDAAVARAASQMEERIQARTERSLEQMAESANKRLNREAARLRAEVGGGDADNSDSRA
jgi:hypothetical protein